MRKGKCILLGLTMMCLGLLLLYRPMPTARQTLQGTASAGLLLNEENGEWQVTAVMEGSRADQAGIIPGDLVTGIEGIQLTADHIEELFTNQEQDFTLLLLRDGRAVRLILPAP